MSQVDANRRWADKNKEHNRYLTYRSTARGFIRKYATREDLDELRTLINKREKEL